MNNKKTFYTIIAISILLVIFFVIYLFSSGCSTSDLMIESVNDDKVFFSHYSPSSDSIEYLSDLGVVWYKYDLISGEKTKIYDGEILSPEGIDYRPDGKNAVVYSSYPEYNVKHYDFTNNMTYDLNANIRSVIWDKQKPKIYYSFMKLDDSTENSDYFLNINESKYDGENWQELKNLTNTEFENTYLYPSDDETYIYYQPYVLDTESELGTLRRLNINLKQDEIMTEENILASKVVFSPDMTKIAFIDMDGNLSIQDIDDKESVERIYEQSIDISQISWSNDNQYIYVIKDLNTLVKINVKNGKTQEYSLGSENIDYTNTMDETIQSLGINNDNSVIYFAYNSHLYYISLK